MPTTASVLVDALGQTFFDVLPILLVIAFFQAWAFRRLPPQIGRIVTGFVAIVLGISFFRAGLGLSLIPMGDDLARHLTDRIIAPEHSTFLNSLGLVAFAATLGLTATLIEPTLTGIAQRIEELEQLEEPEDSREPGKPEEPGLSATAFRLVVAFGMATGLTLGTIRILSGFAWELLLAPLLLLTGLLMLRAPRRLVPLALDSGAAATSVATVPIIAAFGASLAHYLPGRDPTADGFGLVFLALLLPVTALLAWTQIQAQLHRRRTSADLSRKR